MQTLPESWKRAMHIQFVDHEVVYNNVKQVAWLWPVSDL